MSNVIAFQGARQGRARAVLGAEIAADRAAEALGIDRALGLLEALDCAGLPRGPALREALAVLAAALAGEGWDAAEVAAMAARAALVDAAASGPAPARQG